MNIHCSHTRKDLCEIIEIFDLIDYIEDYTDLGKKDLVLKLIDILDSLNNVDYISCYGNIPTIHRAITMLNKDPKIQPKINLIISGKIKIQMRKKQEAKLRQSVSLKKNHGLYVIDLS